uniref:Uncharacterized protein n=1 Tax=Cannabis sativa TaxID=3483 RepID=A0A803NHK0_CANSA
MAKRSCTLVNKLAYELELLKLERTNAEQRREEAIKALAYANAKMESIIKQRVNESLDKVVVYKKKATKTEREHGDRYKVKYTQALSRISDLEVDLKQAKQNLKHAELRQPFCLKSMTRNLNF